MFRESPVLYRVYFDEDTCRRLQTEWAPLLTTTPNEALADRMTAIVIHVERSISPEALEIISR